MVFTFSRAQAPLFRVTTLVPMQTVAVRWAMLTMVFISMGVAMQWPWLAASLLALGTSLPIRLGAPRRPFGLSTILLASVFWATPCTATLASQ